MSELPTFARFWMICRKPSKPHHKTGPRQRYSTRGDAQHTAEGVGSERRARNASVEGADWAGFEALQGEPAARGRA